MTPNSRELAPFQSRSAGSVEIPCGNFFAPTPELPGTLGGFYDRVPPVDLASPLRRRCSPRLAELPAAGNRGLLPSLEYPQAEMDRPPLAVNEAEVQVLFGRAFRSRLLHTLDVLENNPKLAERGLGRLQEKAYLLRNRLSARARACIRWCRMPTYRRSAGAAAETLSPGPLPTESPP